MDTDKTSKKKNKQERSEQQPEPVLFSDVCKKITSQGSEQGYETDELEGVDERSTPSKSTFTSPRTVTSTPDIRTNLLKALEETAGISQRISDIARNIKAPESIALSEKIKTIEHTIEAIKEALELAKAVKSSDETDVQFLEYMLEQAQYDHDFHMQFKVMSDMFIKPPSRPVMEVLLEHYSKNNQSDFRFSTEERLLKVLTYIEATLNSESFTGTPEIDNQIVRACNIGDNKKISPGSVMSSIVRVSQKLITGLQAQIAEKEAPAKNKPRQ